jgi:hypothetical protein
LNGILSCNYDAEEEPDDLLKEYKIDKSKIKMDLPLISSWGSYGPTIWIALSYFGNISTAKAKAFITKINPDIFDIFEAEGFTMNKPINDDHVEFSFTKVK